MRLAAVASPANLLTVVRLPLAAALWARPQSPAWFLGVTAIAALTDMLDGRVARRLRRDLAPARRAEDQAVGAWLDPLCDKAFAASMLAVLAVGFDAPLWILALALARELLLAPLALIYKLSPVVRDTLRVDFSADWTGKLATALQFSVAVAIVLLPAAAAPLAAAAALVGVYAAVHYVARGIRAARAALRNPLARR